MISDYIMKNGTRKHDQRFLILGQRVPQNRRILAKDGTKIQE